VLDPAKVLGQFDPDSKLTPPNVREVIDRSQPDQLNAPSCKIHNQILCNNQTAVAAAKEKAISLGYDVVRAETVEQDRDAGSAGNSLAEELLAVRSKTGKRCVISGGEPTVNLGDNPGKGGRNQHLVLAGLQRLVKSESDVFGQDDSNFCMLSGGTDGEDGNVPVAGAWLDSSLEVAHLSNEIDGALKAFDSYVFWERQSCLIRVPPTRTNVCDLRVVVTDG